MQIPKSLLTAWKVSVSEAEQLLPGRHKGTGDVLDMSVNGEERVPAAVPELTETLPEVRCSPFSADPVRPVSPGAPAPNGTSQPPATVNAAASQGYQKKGCRKKKKCLSDIFGHIVGGLKDAPTTLDMVSPLPKVPVDVIKDSKDSPYSDLDSIPMLSRPKRAAEGVSTQPESSPKVDTNEPGPSKEKEEECVANTDTAPEAAVNPAASTGTETSANKSVCHENRDLSDSKSNAESERCKEAGLADGPLDEHSLHLPASSGLMTRALKAKEETELKEAQTPSQNSQNNINNNNINDSKNDDDRDVTQSNAAAGAESSSPPLLKDSSHQVLSSSSHSSPKRRARKPEKKRHCNGALTKSDSGSSPVPPVPLVKIKTENVMPELSVCPSSLPPPSLSPLMDTFQGVKELTFKSLVKKEEEEESEDCEDLSTFHPDANYKFSTFLMLLKDMHDTREKEGKPLTVPPPPVLIKEEPLVVPTSSGTGDPDPLLKGNRRERPAVKMENGWPGKPLTTPPTPQDASSTGKPKKKTKAIMKNDTYKFKGMPILSPATSADRQRRKQRLPAKLKASIPGLSPDLADLAYGREFVSGHADLAEPSSLGPSNADPSANYLDKSCESKMAPKKRWQMAEGVGEKVCEDGDGGGAVGGPAGSRVCPEVNGGSCMDTSRLSPDHVGSPQVSLGDGNLSEDCSNHSDSSGKDHKTVDTSVVVVV